MDNENTAELDALEQDEEVVEDLDESSTSEDKEKYLSQKKRAEKAEATAKEAKEKLEALEKKVQSLNQEPKSETKVNDEPLSRDETILIAKGYSDDEVETAKKLSLVEGTTIADAVKTEMFTAWKAQRDEKASNEKAQLGASNGSAPHSEEGFKAGMTDEDHKALFAKKFKK